MNPKVHFLDFVGCQIKLMKPLSIAAATEKAFRLGRARFAYGVSFDCILRDKNHQRITKVGEYARSI